MKIKNCSNSRKPSNATILNFLKFWPTGFFIWNCPLQPSLHLKTVNQLLLACEILKFMKDSSRIFCFLHNRKPKKCNPVKEEKRSLKNKIRQSTIGHISYITRVLTNVIAKMSQRKQSAIFSCFDEKISMVYIQRQRRIIYIIIPKPNSSFFIPLKLL